MTGYAGVKDETDVCPRLLRDRGGEADEAGRDGGLPRWLRVIATAGSDCSQSRLSVTDLLQSLADLQL